MGLIQTLRSQNVYFDANIFIYLLEGSDNYSQSLSDITSLIANNQISVVCSDLVYTEMLPYHAKRNNHKAIAHIIDFLDNFQIVRLSREIAIHAGILRGETGMKTPDALHVATAINQQCDIFLTNDARVYTPHNMQCVLLSDFSDDK
jgi:predicted nucleic acid-binding protein